jgi:hypothetical protein
MRCSGSPTTCIAADPRAAEEERTAREVMSAVLFREILKPLAQGLGPVGEVALGGVADALFVRRLR